ncbi:transcriptional regulator [Shewanella sp. UCD-KL12]|uniref:transcriptional regulator n=1 Tax=Shewanella sp. UCD-KL12 TaxID=1917163 RepID=UPI000970DEE3|nr:winged helix-turn-helix domain-containing protein [Shewanella sp. UCD-KL12]
MKITEFLIIDLDARDLVDLKSSSRSALSLAELEVLKCLVEHVGEVVSKEVLNDAGWPQRVVAPSSLTQCMSSLRKKLASQDEIELKNIPRYGYSLCIVDTAGFKEQAFTSTDIEKSNMGDFEPSGKITTKAAVMPSTAQHRRNFIYRWLSLVGLLVVIATLHFTGSLKRVVNTLSLITEPNIASITERSFALAEAPSLANTVLLDNQHDQRVPVEHQFDNWVNYDAVLNNSSDKQMFMFDNGQYESIALCNEFEKNCVDSQPLNLVRSIVAPIAPLDIQWLADTKLRMEQVTYNKILLDQFEGSDKGVVEDIFRADVYYYSESKNVVRADVRLSLIFDSDIRGKLVAAACITDDQLKEISIRYQFSGDFKLKQSKVDGKTVKTFLVDINDRTFTRPQTLSKESATIYREIRKSVLQNERMVLRQLYQDDESGVWMLPLWGDTMVWAHREQISL